MNVIANSERTDDLAIVRLGKRLQGFRGDVPRCRGGKAELRTKFVVWELGDQDGIVLAHGEIPTVNFPTHRFRGFSCGIEPGRAVFNL